MCCIIKRRCENLFTKSLPMLEEASLECAGTDACANEKETCFFCRARRKKTKLTDCSIVSGHLTP